MLSTATKTSANRYQHSKPVTVAMPLQYAGCKLDIKNATSTINQVIKQDLLAIASAPLDATIYDYASKALPAGLGVDAITQYSQLPSHERTTQYNTTMMALHGEFAEYCESFGFSKLEDWGIAFNKGEPALELRFWFAYGVLKDCFKDHPLTYFIRAFADLIANDYGATTCDELAQYGFGFWEDYIEVKDKTAFIKNYHTIYGDIIFMEDDEELEPEDIANQITEKYDGIVIINEYVCKEMIESCFDSLRKTETNTVTFKNSKELLLVVLATVETFQLWSDPIAAQLVSDIIEYQHHYENVTITGLERTDDSAMWQHLVLLNTTRLELSDSMCECIDRLGQDCMNEGSEMKFDISLSEPSWPQDIQCVTGLMKLTLKYFEYEYCC